MKGVQRFFKSKKQAVEYAQKQIAIAEREVNTVLGMPTYSSNGRRIANRKKAVKKAPEPSIRKSVLGFSARRRMNFFLVLFTQHVVYGGSFLSELFWVWSVQILFHAEYTHTFSSLFLRNCVAAGSVCVTREVGVVYGSFTNRNAWFPDRRLLLRLKYHECLR